MSRGRGAAWVLAAAVAVAVTALVLRIDLSPRPEVTRFRDDAYYYFGWAASLARGDGPAVGASGATNGVHVAWGLLLTAVAALLGGAALPGAAQALGLACHAAAAGVLAVSAGRASRALRCGVALAFLADPFLLTEAQNGQETALGVLALCALCAAHRAPALHFAAASVLAVAARSDLIVFVAALSACRAESWPRRAFPLLAALAAYAVWNTALAGHPVQDSALPMPWLMHDAFESTSPTLGERLGHLWWWGRPVALGWPFALGPWVAVGFLVRSALGPLPRAAALAALAAALAGLAAGVDMLAVPIAALALTLVEPPGRTTLPRALLLGAVALAVLHLPLREYPRDYYFAPIAAAGYLAVAHAGASLRRPWLLLLLLAGDDAVRLCRPPPRHEFQEAMAMAGRFAGELVPRGDTIGSFNAGLVAWLRDGPVVNLDGVVDRSAFEALRARRLDAWLHERGVRWLLDHPVQVARSGAPPHATGRYFGAGFDAERDLLEVARFVVPGVDAGRDGTDCVRLWARAGTAPETGAATVSLRDLGAAPDGGRYVVWRAADGRALELAALDGSGRTGVLAHGVPGVALVLRVPPLAAAHELRVAGDAQPLLRLAGL